MDNSIKIVLREDEANDSDILNLIHLAFEERRLQGLQFTCIGYTLDDIKRKASKASVYLAYINQLLVGCLFFTIFHKKDKYGYIEALSVHPDFKGRGIMNLLFQKSLEEAKRMNLDYIKSDTSVDAQSSVRWHLKNGFRKVGLMSSPRSNYYSYVFRNQLQSPSIWNSKVWTNVRLFVSSVKCKSTRNREGGLTSFGKIVKSIKRRIFSKGH